ncbi:unnamed protein product [Rotaria sordida]|uniref:G-protein coupled receptors family 1 profile domain-containing protein n=1 Tax=Rotaria sordida TaxID=392033 RepID=A0A815B020_9BILA|nr:unnamed protein product [Rotaria sordida]CAF1264347.1 unnamed protein product [Rotaria sordida]CAF4191131.1 unnamed protein product [Rotaria sordida]
MSSVPLSSATLTTMNLAQKYLYEFAGPILILIGTISCIINLVVFTQKDLRKNPCSIYFIAHNIVNLIFIYSSLLALTLGIGYNISALIYKLILCRVYLYVVILSNCLSPFYLILASIDRILLTSSNARIRQRSNRRFACLCIIIGTSFWSLFHIHALISSNIRQMGPNTYLCYFQQGIHLIFATYYSLTKESLILILLLICGLWSIKNIRSLHRVRIDNTLSTTRTNVEGKYSKLNSSKDRQLTLMLLMDIIIYALFSLAFAIFLIYQQITQNPLMSLDRIQIENVIRNFCLFSASIPFCTSCYANLIISKTFRNETKKAFKSKIIFCLI